MLPAEVVQHIVAKTDGVPLYVEELTKMLLASPLLQEEAEQFGLTGPLRAVAIPETLQDALMARLDQLPDGQRGCAARRGPGAGVSLCAAAAIAPQAEDTLQAGLAQLVGAELLYQRGRPPQARYIFKHALIQDAAYASLLKSTASTSTGRLPKSSKPGSPPSLRPSQSWWPSITRRQAAPSRPSATGSRRASVPSSARRTWKPSAISPGGSRSLPPCRTPPSVSSRS